MDDPSAPAIRFVDTSQELEAVAGVLEKESAVAVDLEADSMYHFQEKVCLLQVATEGLCAVIDPIGLKDLACLERFFADSGIRKIFHGADYDVRSLYRDFRFAVNNLFDTQIACMFLGIRETGLNAVLGERFGITLDKRFQRKDWSQRPLPEDMIRYAAQDTLYLKRLADQLERELSEKGRLEWVLEECELLSRVRPAAPGDGPLFLRFRGAGKLDRRKLALLEALLSLRSRLAQKKDRPPYKIMSNQALLALVEHKACSPAQLNRLRVLSPKQIQMYGQAVAAAVSSALDIPEDRLPVYPRKKTPPVSPAVPPRLQALKAWREKVAADLQIEPGVLINNALLNAIATENPRSEGQLAGIEGMKNWQMAALGADVLAVLKGGRKRVSRSKGGAAGPKKSKVQIPGSAGS
jgi:ribonuclease D